VQRLIATDQVGSPMQAEPLQGERREAGGVSVSTRIGPTVAT